MAATDATAMLRAGLLEGVSLLLARAPDGAPSADARDAASAVSAACTSLGARVIELTAAPGGGQPFEEEVLERELDGALDEGGALDIVVIDGAGLHAAAGARTGGPGAEGDGREALRACLDGSWNVTRAAANRAFLATGRPGRILFIAPAPGAGAHAGAAAAGLENLARTLSIEWARHRVTAVSLAPGDRT
ncbi:MAG TPA: hypothetical protein VF380_04125, partial [Solirubrobacteraceae bacterium]